MITCLFAVLLVKSLMKKGSQTIGHDSEMTGSEIIQIWYLCSAGRKFEVSKNHNSGHLCCVGAI